MQASFISESEFAEEVAAADSAVDVASEMSRAVIQAFVETESKVSPTKNLEDHLEVLQLTDADISHLDIPDVNDAEVDELLARTEDLNQRHLISFAEEFATATADANMVLNHEAEAPKQTNPEAELIAAAEAEMRADLDGPAKDPIDLSDLEPIPEL